MKQRSLLPASLSRNLSFEKALVLLAHPVSILAAVLLLLNDHIFRWVWPSWFTGKIGDVAWLFFSPFAVAAVLSWLLPLKEPVRERWAFGLGFASVGFCFVLVNSIQRIGLMAIRIIADLFHTKISITPDPYDLLTLPALCLSFFLWKNFPGSNIPRLSSRGLVLLPVAALLTVANMGIPDQGISCFVVKDNMVYAVSTFKAFSTADGGLTWELDNLFNGPDCPSITHSEGTWREVSAQQPATIYRIASGRNIQLTIDAGKTWQDVYKITPTSEAKRYYLLKSRSGYTEFDPGPLDAMADPVTSNMLFAMGHQGVLVQTESGDWVWSKVGEYAPLESFPTPDAFWLLLNGMMAMAGALVLLVFCAQALRWAGGTVRLVILILAWIGWILVVAFFPPPQMSGYSSTISTLGTAGVFLLTIPLFVDQMIRLARRSPWVLLRLVGFGLLSGLLFLLPYFLWLFSTLPTLLWATVFSLGITAAMLLAAVVSVRRWQPPPFTTP